MGRNASTRAPPVRQAAAPATRLTARNVSTLGRAPVQRAIPTRTAPAPTLAVRAVAPASISTATSVYLLGWAPDRVRQGICTRMGPVCTSEVATAPIAVHTSTRTAPTAAKRLG